MEAHGIDGSVLPLLNASRLPTLGIENFAEIRGVMAHIRMLLTPPTPFPEAVLVQAAEVAFAS